MDTTLSVPWTILPRPRAVIITNRADAGRPPEECGAALWAVSEAQGPDVASVPDDTGMSDVVPGPRFDVGLCTDRFGAFVVVPLEGLRATDGELHRIADEASQILAAEQARATRG